jgi:hypothetical protein
MCDTCGLIWPCPPIRTRLIAQVTTEDEAAEPAATLRIRNGLALL